MNDATFSEIERDGWQRNATDYDAVDLPATRQAFAPLLDSVGDLRGHQVLEVASGTGHLAAEAVRRGATVVGVDVAPAMVALARRRVPGVSFHEANAETLPFKDEQFDSVICCFGLIHFAEPARALKEMARVLKSGGTLSFTVWQAPEQGGKFFGLILDTYQTLANMDVGLPPAPPMFTLADPAVHEPMLAQAGFRGIRRQDIAIVWPLRGAETIVEFVLKGAVRTRMVYERQTATIQQRIREALIAATIPYLGNTPAGIPCPALLVTGRRM